MKIGDRVKTNEKCDFKNEIGTIVNISNEGNCLIVKLDNGMNILTMYYTVDLISE